MSLLITAPETTEQLILLARKTPLNRLVFTRVFRWPSSGLASKTWLSWWSPCMSEHTARRRSVTCTPSLQRYRERVSQHFK